MKCFQFLTLVLLIGAVQAGPVKTPNIGPSGKAELLFIDNGEIRVGIDREMGAAITHLSGAAYRKNMVNIHDPGRLIQQSYYAGNRLDRTAEGQSPSWAPWAWNPIQGGGVGSWARVTVFEKRAPDQLYAETIPKLWDMPDEEAEARMRQWTSFENGMPKVVVVQCELECRRQLNDQWGPAVIRPQEVPALYFTRNFSKINSYLGEGEWRDESRPIGPPWGRTVPPLNVMACFNAGGQGIAIFSPSATEHWNFGPHGGGNSSMAGAAPCVHVAPIAKVNLGPQSILRYRYWLVQGTEAEIVEAIDALLVKYADEEISLRTP
ncbi:MAG: hypothetical protein P1U68_06550 [Verrucomicrobiales bacterium]|nr:hypothetical protein [Verrucomicrobiales bacterium]